MPRTEPGHSASVQFRKQVIPQALTLVTRKGSCPVGNCTETRFKGRKRRQKGLPPRLHLPGVIVLPLPTGTDGARGHPAATTLCHHLAPWKTAGSSGGIPGLLLPFSLWPGAARWPISQRHPPCWRRLGGAGGLPRLRPIHTAPAPAPAPPTAQGLEKPSSRQGSDSEWGLMPKN